MNNRAYIKSHLLDWIRAMNDNDLLALFETIALFDGEDDYEWARTIEGKCGICQVSAEECTGGDCCPITVEQYMDHEVVCK